MADRLQRRRRRRRRVAELYNVGFRAFYEGVKPHRQSREPLKFFWRVERDTWREVPAEETADGPF